MSGQYETVIGLEVHIELATKTKIFCGCSTEFGSAPNTHTCPVCTGMPGSLPVLNKQVVEYAMALGLAANCKITQVCKFDRKNYFYPDNPQNYQISQLYLPIARDGYVEIETPAGEKKVRIHEMHMEEDAGKLVHDEWDDTSLVDYNRSGVPLVEIVSEPDMRSADEVIAYLEKLRMIAQYLGVSDCKLQEGSMRADVNLSVRKAGTDKLGTRTEMKNLNSFKAIAHAIEGERARQIEILEAGKEVVQETRRWDDNKESSYAMRSKEDAQDYRYFPEPDLVPIVISDEWIKAVKARQPELRPEKLERETRDSGRQAPPLTHFTSPFCSIAFRSRRTVSTDTCISSARSLILTTAWSCSCCRISSARSVYSIGSPFLYFYLHPVIGHEEAVFFRHRKHLIIGDASVMGKMIRHIDGIFIHKPFLHQPIADLRVGRKSHMPAAVCLNGMGGIKAHQIQLHRMADQIFPGFLREQPRIMGIQERFPILFNEIDHRLAAHIMLCRQRSDPVALRFKGLEGLHTDRHHPVLHHVMIRIARSLVNGRHHLRISRIGSVNRKRLSVDAVGKSLLPVEKLILVKMIFMVMGDEAGVDGRQIQPVKQAVDVGIRIQIEKQRIVYDRLASRPDVSSSGLSAPFTYLAFTESGRHSLACRSSQISDFHIVPSLLFFSVMLPRFHPHRTPSIISLLHPKCKTHFY